MTREDVAVGDAVLRERVEQRAGDVVLADDVVEACGAVFAGEDLVWHLAGLIVSFGAGVEGEAESEELGVGS